MMSYFDIAVIGSTTVDIIEKATPQATSKVVKMGVVTTYAGITFHKHGLRAAVVSNISTLDKHRFKVFSLYNVKLELTWFIKTRPVCISQIYFTDKTFAKDFYRDFGSKSPQLSISLRLYNALPPYLL